MENKVLTFIFLAVVCTMAQGDESPLFLTELINSGQIDKARELAKVGELSESTDLERESYSGLVTVDSEKNSNLFFWFFPAIESPSSAPLILWLDGGPGVTVFVSLFNQHGPWKVDVAGNLSMREHDWTRKHSIVYLENPVGTGYSFTDQESGYSKSSDEAAENAYKFLIQFFKLFPEYLTNPFHIGGISYGGHFAPPLFQLIHETNVKPETELQINLSRLLLFCPWSHPVNQVNYGSYLRNIGLIEENHKLHFDSEYDAIKELLANGEFVEAKARSTQLLSKPDSYLYNKTGFSSASSVLQDKVDLASFGFISFVQTPAFHRAVHVGNLTYDMVSPPAQRALDADFMTSVKPNIVNILNYRWQDRKFNVTFIVGQMDLSVIHTGIETTIAELEWDGKQQFESEERRIWKVGGEVAGFIKEGGNLQYIFVRNAGHMLVQDQPGWSLDLINKVIMNILI